MEAHGPGDIVLYNGKSVVIFYGSNSWDYTPLARIPDATADSMKAFLGNSDTPWNFLSKRRTLYYLRDSIFHGLPGEFFLLC